MTGAVDFVLVVFFLVAEPMIPITIRTTMIHAHTGSFTNLLLHQRARGAGGGADAIPTGGGGGGAGGGVNGD